MSDQCKQPQAHPSRCGCEQVKFCNIAALRAMAHNYADGHCWDHLDGNAVISAADEIVALQAECERYKHAWCEWHRKTEWVQETGTAKELGKHRADILRERIDSLKAECERLREQVAALQSAENSYQSGFDAGRKSVHEFAQSWRKQYETAKDELAAIKAQEPVALIEVQFTPRGLCAPFIGPTWLGGNMPPEGTKLYALPAATPPTPE